MCSASPRRRQTRSVNQIAESSRRVGYLRGTVEVSNFCKSPSFHRFGNRVARESLRRELCTGSLFWCSGKPAAHWLTRNAESESSGVSCLRGRKSVCLQTFCVRESIGTPLVPRSPVRDARSGGRFEPRRFVKDLARTLGLSGSEPVQVNSTVRDAALAELVSNSIRPG